MLVVLVGLAAVWVQAQRAGDKEATARALAVAETVAATPDVIAGVQGSDPTAALQPYAERVRAESGTDFVVVMSPAAIRWTHPDPTQIGKRFIGHTESALAGGVVQEQYTGTLGPSARVVVPVTDAGRVVALVSVGIRTSAVGEQVRAQLPGILAAGLVAALLSGLGTALPAEAAAAGRPLVASDSISPHELAAAAGEVRATVVRRKRPRSQPCASQARIAAPSSSRVGGASCSRRVTSVPSPSKKRSGGPGRVTRPSVGCSTSTSRPWLATWSHS